MRLRANAKCCIACLFFYKTRCLCIFARNGHIRIVCVFVRAIVNYSVCAFNVNRMLCSWFARICQIVFGLRQIANRIFVYGCAQTLNSELFVKWRLMFFVQFCAQLQTYSLFVRCRTTQSGYVYIHLQNYASFGVQQDRIFVYAGLHL